MTSNKIEIEKLHFEHKLWSNELNFFADELRIYEHRLENLVSKNNDKDMLAQLEQFQNQFIRQKEVLDQLQHDIKIHEQVISNLAKVNGKTNDKDIRIHDKIEDQMDTFRKIYGDLKKEFYEFMTRWK